MEAIDMVSKLDYKDKHNATIQLSISSTKTIQNRLIPYHSQHCLQSIFRFRQKQTQARATPKIGKAKV